MLGSNPGLFLTPCSQGRIVIFYIDDVLFIMNAAVAALGPEPAGVHPAADPLHPLLPPLQLQEHKTLHQLSIMFSARRPKFT
jgi:hypothetical protein